MAVEEFALGFAAEVIKPGKHNSKIKCRERDHFVVKNEDKIQCREKEI